ncbi:MAG: glycogen synthase [Sphingobacteriales bacterium]|nr:MAG: glycogen synthase [Sphingobacteriales bacterium]TAF78400.1 MAG: glycogen synthase [Sphingobacteriales bacterium]
MTVFNLSAECYPVAKVGGLGDVVGALPKYLVSEGIDAKVILPFYDKIFTQTHTFESVFKGQSNLGDQSFAFEVLKESTNVLSFELYLIKIPGLIDRTEVYCYPDEIKQFIAYQISVLEWVITQNIKVDIFHCHDHHSGLVPFLIQYATRFDSLRDIPTVLTIHNAQYQGWLGWDKFNYLPNIDVSKTGLLDWAGCINSLATAVKCCTRYTTVSPGYLQELKTNSNGLEHLFYMEQQKGLGIINGIDPDVWNPNTDTMLAHNYSITTVKKGKENNKKALCTQFGLDDSKPLITFIGRLVLEKGADILPYIISTCLEHYKSEVSFLVLGSGEKYIEEALSNISISHHYNFFIGYDEQLSHRIYAAADFILMPSRVEPCGLNQLYALKYGTIPIVRSTGGLKDTVIDVEENNGYGILFENTTPEDAIQAIAKAITLYKNTKKIAALRKIAMGLNFSWNQSAKQYIQLYNSLITKL